MGLSKTMLAFVMVGLFTIAIIGYAIFYLLAIVTLSSRLILMGNFYGTLIIVTMFMFINTILMSRSTMNNMLLAEVIQFLKEMKNK